MIGKTISHYRIVDKIGEGGMGEVYLAEDSRLKRKVAVKILPVGFAGDSERRQRFEREANVVSTLSHPNICVLHDIGEHEGRLFLVMEYLEGDNLAERLDKGALPSSQVLRIGAEIGEALAAAHSAGIVHRDLKPANIVLTASGAKLLDFGLAGLADEAPLEPLQTALRTEKLPLTEEGTLLGTYPYMAPEQLEGRAADPRTDIFALGSVLHEMATGQRAFEGETRASSVSWSPDGRQILYSTDHSQTGSDIHVVPADGSAQPRPIIATPADERLPFVSPDGRWLVYESDESGDREIFVATYPEGERKRQVTTGNFLQLSRWSDDGSQLVYAGTDQGLWALPVERLGGDLRFDAPKHIFGGLDLQDSWGGSMAGDLQRAMFSVVEPMGPAQLELVLNWQNLLDR